MRMIYECKGLMLDEPYVPDPLYRPIIPRELSLEVLPLSEIRRTQKAYMRNNFRHNLE